MGAISPGSGDSASYDPVGYALRILERKRHNLLAQPTSLIGRERELTDIKQLLLSDDVRVLTLTGVGGAGKTRLGAEVASQLLDTFRDGVFFVSLAAIHDPEFVVSAIALALDVRETSERPIFNVLKDYLSDKETLLVLDNFEHLVLAATRVAELLSACPRMKVLTTSRTPLHIRGEREFQVMPLPMPDPNFLPPLEEMQNFPAVTLLVSRTRYVRPDFTLTKENAHLIAEICCRLDGLPLALELAAARMKVYSPQEILVRLESRLTLLTKGPLDLPPRQQTLRDAIAWSYGLLSSDEKLLFERLSVFEGGCTVDAADVVCRTLSMQIEVTDGLFSLVDKNLIQHHEAKGETRFQMLETIREYSLERLKASGEAQEVQSRHADYFLALAEKAEPDLSGPRQGMWLGRLEQEHDNLRTAYRLFRGKDEAEKCLRLVTALWLFWYGRGYVTEGRARLSEALDRMRVHTRVRMRALNAAARLALVQGDQARLLAEESLEIANELSDNRGIAVALGTLGHLANNLGDYADGKALSMESLKLSREFQDKQGMARALFQLGNVALWRSEYDEARIHYQDSLALSRELGDKRSIALSINNLGLLDMVKGELSTSRSLLKEGLDIFRELGDRFGVAVTIGNLGEVALFQGDYELARTLCERSLAVHRQLGSSEAAYYLLVLGNLSRDQGDAGAARSLYEESLSIFRKTVDLAGVAEALTVLAGVLRNRGDQGGARKLCEEGLALNKQLGNRSGIARSLNCLALIEHSEGKYEQAASLLKESLSLFARTGEKIGIASCFEGLAAAYAHTHPERATQLFEAAEIARKTMGAPLPRLTRYEYEHILSALHVELGDKAYAQAIERGRTMTLQDAIHYAEGP